MGKGAIMVEDRNSGNRQSIQKRQRHAHNFMKAALLSNIKHWLRCCLGDAAASWIHAVRFCLLFDKPEREPEIALIPTLLNEGDIAIDVGANGANWTKALSKAVGVTGKVYAFEADPYYARVIETQLNSWA
jgi:hypothetical protein